MSGLFGVIAWVNSPETHAPTLLTRRAKRLRHETGDWRLHSKHEERRVDLKEIAQRYLLRPAIMMTLEPILVLVTLYLAFVYGEFEHRSCPMTSVSSDGKFLAGLVYLFFEAYPISFVESRRWSAGLGSLPFISILIGVLIGCAIMAFTTKTKLAPNPKEGRGPETRLLLMAAGGVVLPIGLFWFAWTSSRSINPAPQIIAGIPIGCAVIMITLQGINYLIDCYTINANSAIAAMTLVRSLFGAGFPMFAGGMFHNLGISWATSTLAFIAIALIPVPILFFKFGAKIRTFSKYVPN